MSVVDLSEEETWAPRFRKNVRRAAGIAGLDSFDW